MLIVEGPPRFAAFNNDVGDGGGGCDVVTDGGDGCGVVTDGGDGCGVVTDGGDKKYFGPLPGTARIDDVINYGHFRPTDHKGNHDTNFF